MPRQVNNMIGAVTYSNAAIQNDQTARSVSQDMRPQAAYAAVGNNPSTGVDFSIKQNAGFDQYIPGKTKDALQNDRIGVKNSSQSGDVQSSASCQTWSKRRYQDGSNDMGVSFKSPTHIAPGNAAAAVAAHENEHVVRAKAKASEENREVISQSVQIYTAVCPECGKAYVSGGKTRTVTASKPETANNQNTTGNNLDMYA